MNAEIKGGNLVVTIDMTAPQLSSTGKTLIVASTVGPKVTEVMVDGKPVTINLSAWIKR